MQTDHLITSRRAGGHWRTLLFALVVLAGCSNTSPGPPSVVTGKVTLAGAPLAAGTVLFVSETGNAASAELKGDGTYVLRCNPDRFHVAVTPPPPLDPLAAPAASPLPSPSIPPAIPKRYHEFGTSGLTVEVKKGDNTYDISLPR